MESGNHNISKIVLYSVKIILLLLLALCKDLGKRKSLRLFCFIAAMDVVGMIVVFINMTSTGFDIGPVIGVIASLIADGTIELSVKGKYKDKEARGSK